MFRNENNKFSNKEGPAQVPIHPQHHPLFLKEESDISRQIARFKELQEKATGKVKDDIDREITLASYGEVGEKSIAFELKNSGMPMCIIHDLRLEFEDLSAQID